MEFSLSEKEIEKRDQVFENLKAVFGEVGTIEYRFTPTGIGNGTTIYSKLADREYDITDYDSW